MVWLPVVELCSTILSTIRQDRTLGESVGIENPIRRREVAPNKPIPKRAPQTAPAPAPATPAKEPEKTPA